MTTATALKDAGIKTALIVDDGYDVAPKLNDIDGAEWSTFFQDLREADFDLLDEIYPEGRDVAETVLQKHQKYLSAIWKNRSRFRAELMSILFDDYDRSYAQDKIILANLKKLLTDEGLKVETSGREFAGKAANADLVVVDMFWGVPQKAAHKHQATDALSAFLKDRPVNPPAIILMSSSPGIYDVRDKFRDSAGIFEAGFGVIRKAHIKEAERLPRILRELSYTRKDALKLHSFVHSWKSSLSDAVAATEKDIRKLDLHDWALIDELLLSGEKVGAGSYMLDIFDGVLQHEIERDPGVIKAAQNLDGLNGAHRPRMATPSTRDTLSILNKTLYRHPSRRKLISEKGFPVQFGDVIGLKKGANPSRIFKGSMNTVFFVMTPACDLMPREKSEASHVTLVAGTFETLSENIAGGRLESLETSLLQIDKDTRVKVKWNAAHISSLTKLQVKNLLGKDGPATVVGSMREGPATSIQQQILSKLGRIGITAPLPSTFHAKIEIYYTDNNNTRIPLSLRSHNPLRGICYVGRDSRGNPKIRVPVDPDAYHEIYNALSSLQRPNVQQQCFSFIGKILVPSIFERLFSDGILLKSTRENPVPIKPAQIKINTKDKGVYVGTVVYNQTLDEAVASNKNRALEGLIVRITTPKH